MIAHLILLLAHRRKGPFAKRLGYVADFCPICRDAQAFRLTEFGVGEEVKGHYMECEECGALLVTRENKYSFVAGTRQPDLELLIQTTHPSLRFAYADRLKLEGELKKGKARLTVAERHRLMLEPLTALSYMVDRRFADATRLDTPSSFGCGLTAAITMGLFIFSTVRLRGQSQDQGLWLALIALGLGFIFSVYQLHRAPFRFVRKRIAALAGRALRRLGPGRKDLEEALGQCRQMNLRIGKVLKPDWLWLSVQLSENKLPR